MNWIKLLNNKRFNDDSTNSANPDARSEYQRDVDRVLFSTPFRRMGDKTQVFPIPSSDFVHNRLTHSLEVASSGRSLGMLAGNFILSEKCPELLQVELKHMRNKFLPEDFANIVHAACLAHDIGNPPFGHSGEKSISHYFKNDSKKLRKVLSKKELIDLCSYEGNASGFRILTTNNYSGFPGGLRLTYATLGAFTKYPWDSSVQELHFNKKYKSAFIKEGKFGFFQSEICSFENIAIELGLIKKHKKLNIWCRHPLSYLMEAADTITYYIIDIEDSHKLGLISFDEAVSLLSPIWQNSQEKNFNLKKLEKITGKGETIGFLRAKAINSLIFEAFDVWRDNYELIMEGNFEKELVDLIPSRHLLNDLKECLKERAFNNIKVLQIELAGFEILGSIINEFTKLLFDRDSSKSKKLKLLLPKKYKHSFDATTLNYYDCMLHIVDYVSGMTDGYAINFYKTLKGYRLPEIK